MYGNITPWVNNQDFINKYISVSKNTLVSVDRFWSIYEILMQTNNIEGDIIEVGVYKGGTGAFIALNTDKKVFLCDTFSGIVKATRGLDAAYVGGEHESPIEELLELLNNLNITNALPIKGIFPEETGDKVSTKFSFIHLDVDVYRSVMDCLIHLWPCLTKGGIIVIDDYGFDSCPGAKTAVDEFVKNREDLFFIYNFNGQGLICKIK
jgi:O-methyltransferase